MRQLVELIRFRRGKPALVRGRFGDEEFGHGGFREVAAVEVLPLVAEFGQGLVVMEGEGVELRRQLAAIGRPHHHGQRAGPAEGL
ncbi:hypothetical protein GCM10011579_065640 [Streptomyces albiflavescens]|uniref:Uncharacterized protein n=1 Tax=Streptomyces albiflavescens TaxID=1623582 RepID=A0A917YBK3_9ACTN|nr:hypothetical protein GCM10011579_065640 [Streptomyces albiflavescens]